MKKEIIVLALILVVSIRIYSQGYSPTCFSKADFVEDLEFLNQKVAHIHPKLLDPKELEQWKNLFVSIEKNLPDSITYNDAYIKVSNILATLHDGHSYFLFSYAERTKYMQNGGITMPFTVRLVKDKIYINQYFGDNQSEKFSGTEILTINSIPSGEILRKMRNLSGSVSTYDVEHYFGPYFWMFWGEQPEYRISVAHADSIFSITTKGVSTTEFFALKRKYYPEKVPKDYELTFVEPNSTAVLKIKRFVDDLAPFLRHAFDTVKYKNSKNLIIDVRNNPGGNSRSVDSLLSYMISRPYTQYSSIRLRVSDEVKDYYQKNKPGVYQLIAPLPADTIYRFDENELISSPIPKSNFFAGNIFVLTNNQTFSAAATFTGVVKEYQLGKVIGQPTGELIFYYADYLKFCLPHMGIEFSVSPKEFVQHGGVSLNQGVIPDISLKDANCKVAEVVMKYCNSPTN